jgi:hypothetical protein
MNYALETTCGSRRFGFGNHGRVVVVTVGRVVARGVGIAGRVIHAHLSLVAMILSLPLEWSNIVEVYVGGRAWLDGD